MLKKLFAAICIAAVADTALAQDSTIVAPLEISGSVDAYYKYDFAGLKGGTGNIPTYFNSDNNSISLGMVDVMLTKTTGKASFVGELSFGPRGQYQSLMNGDGSDGNSFHIQNLYMTYAFTDKFSVTGGFMGTFIGYEVISPALNFHYSTSYLFGAGPFQNAGIRANYAVSDKVGLMAGVFNDWNSYRDFNGVSHFGAQLALSPVEGWTAYLNVLTGRSANVTEIDEDLGEVVVPGAEQLGSGTIVDLTTSYQISKAFKLGLNAADYSMPNDNAGGMGYSGIALYPQYAASENFLVGLRGEYFKAKDFEGTDGASVMALTLSANLKAGGLTIIPEVRFDKRSEADTFFKKNGDFTKNASQFSIAAVFAF